MCGRYENQTSVEVLTETFDAEPGGDVLDDGPYARTDIRPTQQVAAIVTGERRHLTTMRWGFVPDWYRTPTDGPLLINARSETIAHKPAFNVACRTRRCLIPATGFYEWQKLGHRGKRVHYFAPRDGLFAFAGIWQSWGDVTTCAIVTCAAIEALSHIHTRLPIVISAQDYGLWLGEAGHGAARLMQPPPDGFWQVTPDKGPPVLGITPPRLL